MKNYTVCAVICAAGSGVRAGFPKNKIFMPIPPTNESAFSRVFNAFDFPMIDEIVFVVSEKDKPMVTALLDGGNERIKIVTGGKTRFESVHAALQEVKSEIVLIHDGARPFITREVIEGCIASVKTHGSGVCAIPCTDTMAWVSDEKIINVPNREELFAIQTPQGFFTTEIYSAYERAIQSNQISFTDDSSVYRAFCASPHTCPGERKNRKLTYKEDFLSTARVGFGVDTHAFGKEQNHIVLAGVNIPAKSGLIAHSDGDVVTHAVMDALLSAAGLKDIGHYFPDTDEKWRGANSLEMLKRVHAMLLELNFQVENLSVSIQAEHPKLAPHIDEMKTNLSAILQIDPTHIGITAGTNEGLGYVGEGKGITVTAVTLLKQ